VLPQRVEAEHVKQSQQGPGEGDILCNMGVFLFFVMQSECRGMLLTDNRNLFDNSCSIITLFRCCIAPLMLCKSTRVLLEFSDTHTAIRCKRVVSTLHLHAQGPSRPFQRLLRGGPPPSFASFLAWWSFLQCTCVNKGQQQVSCLFLHARLHN